MSEDDDGTNRMTAQVGGLVEHSQQNSFSALPRKALIRAENSGEDSSDTAISRERYWSKTGEPEGSGEDG
jgi:hypothetical protein